MSLRFFFFNDTATTEIYTLSLHDALPISQLVGVALVRDLRDRLDRFDAHFPLGPRHQRQQRIDELRVAELAERSEEHTSELQSPCNLVCRLLLEKKQRQTIKCCCVIPLSQ